MSEQAMVTKVRALSLSVCVPVTWTDDEVKSFADRAALCGTEHGWSVAKQGCAALAGCDERVQCEGAGREGFVHVLLLA